MNLAESYSFWIGVTFYALATILFVVSLVFKKENLLRLAVINIFIGLFPHGLSIILRWIRVGHGPYLNVFEVLSSNTWIALAFYLFAQWKWPKIKWVGSIVSGIALIALGIAANFSREIEYLSPSLQSYWLMIHVFFTKLAFGSFVLSFAIAVFYLYKQKHKKKKEKDQSLVLKLPNLNSLDELSYRFATLGFIFLAIQIIAGAIWANKAWGRYWGWDPVETWALMTWLIYGIYLHLRITYKWKGKKSAWYLFGAIFIMLIAFYIVPYISQSIHAVYFTR